MSDYRTFWQVEGPVFLRPVANERLFFSKSLKPLLERLGHFCLSEQALVVVTGEPGSGKSTVAKWLFENLPQDSHDVLLMTMVQQETESGWLTPRLVELMGLDAAPQGEDLRHVAARLDELIAEGRKLVVVVDTVHLAATPGALGEIAALLNVQTLAGSCLSFVLIGDSTFLQTLDQTPDLRGKVAFNVQLPRLTLDETAAYLVHRAALAKISSPFDAGAVDLIHIRTRGVFAGINAYAENCLVEAFEEGEKRVTAEIAAKAARHLIPEGPVSEAARSSMRTANASQSKGSGRSKQDASKDEDNPRETVAIKLASLFKSDPGRTKPPK